MNPVSCILPLTLELAAASPAGTVLNLDPGGLSGRFANDSNGTGYTPGSTAGNEDAFAGITLTTVPEPSASLLAGLAALGVCTRRRRLN